MYFAIGGVFEFVYYRHRERAAEWKCQPKRWPSPKARRAEILLGTANMTAASTASGVFVYYVTTGGYTTLYSSLEVHGALFTLVTGAVYILGTDLALYWAHRIFHTPRLYKAIHKVHHRWTSPTAFTAMAMHPVEFATYQSMMLIPLFILPVNVYVVIATLVVTNYYALVDHSGVKAHSWLPMIAPAQFHDDHHAHFHVNYGQSFAVWDRLFGTARRKGRRYGVDVFGGQGLGASTAKPSYWDYSRDATNDAAPEPVGDGAVAS
jgi:lathosterol oxidase